MIIAKRWNNQPLLMNTYIGRNCFIKVNATILPVKNRDEARCGSRGYKRCASIVL
jgi:acetyltransferase-like isoleucine patch superfamily enzyme